MITKKTRRIQNFQKNFGSDMRTVSGFGKTEQASKRDGFIPFLSLFIAKHRENLGIRIGNRRRDGFFGSLKLRTLIEQLQKN
jgi:hypothetical protein